MLELFTDQRVKSLVERTICLSGVARSGTTILGALVQSLKNVEYKFEPPSVAYLFHLIDRIPEKEWKYLYSHYLLEDILLPSLSGRGLNFNSNDWSYIFRSKGINDIKSRFLRSLRFQDIFDSLSEYTVAFKIPNISIRLRQFSSYFPSTRLLFTVRNPDAVLHSTMQRGWFRDRISDFATAGPLQCYHNALIPVNTPPHVAEAWLDMSEEARCYSIFIATYQNILELPSPLIIDYDDMVKDAESYLLALCSRWQLSFGEQTSALLETVRPISRTEKAIPSADSSLRQKAFAIWEQCKSKALSPNAA